MKELQAMLMWKNLGSMAVTALILGFGSFLVTGTDLVMRILGAFFLAAGFWLLMLHTALTASFILMSWLQRKEDSPPERNRP